MMEVILMIIADYCEPSKDEAGDWGNLCDKHDTGANAETSRSKSDGPLSLILATKIKRYSLSVSYIIEKEQTKGAFKTWLKLYSLIAFVTRPMPMANKYLWDRVKFFCKKWCLLSQCFLSIFIFWQKNIETITGRDIESYRNKINGCNLDHHHWYRPWFWH